MPAMKVRMFHLRGSWWTWKLPIGAIEREVSVWLAANTGISIREIRHDMQPGFLFPPQFIVTIYYN